MNKQHLIAFVGAAVIHGGVLFGLSNRREISEDLIESIEVSLIPDEEQKAPEIEPQDDGEDDLDESLLPDEFLAPGLAEPMPTSIANDAISQFVRPEAPRLPRLDGTQMMGIPTGAQRKASGGQLANDIFSLDELDRPPAVRYEHQPQYPYELKKSGAPGRAIVLMIVDTNGRVIKADIENASHLQFGHSAQAACLKWRFEPGLRNGRPVAFRVRVPFDFSADR